MIMRESASKNVVNTETRRNQVAFVKALQQTVENSKPGSALQKRVQAAIDMLRRSLGEPRKLKLSVSSEGTSSPSLRVTCPTRSLVSAEIPKPLTPECVEFYLTRPRADGIAETRMIGACKYEDGDGKWTLSFASERFARQPNDSIVVHVEVLGQAGRLLAIDAVGVVD
jgi:hypothetical protein